MIETRLGREWVVVVEPSDRTEHGEGIVAVEPMLTSGKVPLEKTLQKGLASVWWSVKAMVMVMLMDMATGDTETTDGHHDADGANSMRPSPSIQAQDSQQQLGSPAVGAWPGCSIGDHRQHDGWMIGQRKEVGKLTSKNRFYRRHHRRR